ncbi:DMT family transporter [Flavihumibacter profundi]|uniref:DMT family transporter n=1 Tax=Flavihumibacter profundi TaxID=2716883 RepID=UPI001CC4B598|nr:DMT family transporter [Flavihumibacter profundi]MBZ5855882.1 DMT family transporter [Flavihumibacter profundi]
MSSITKNAGTWTGIALAVLATIIWSGNFVIARAVIHEIPPIALAFFRWLTATVCILPLAWNELRREWPVVKKQFPYFLLTGLMGVSLFNTLVYIAGHYSPAINLALIGTTSSPIMAIILARIILKEKVTWLRVTGLSICVTGILYLLSKGSLENLMGLQFSHGDVWVLLGALAFAIYNILVRKKPTGISARAFLFVVFGLGTLLIFPAWLWENSYSAPIAWNGNLVAVILYLGLGTSVISFLCWNEAIAQLGAARTALFGNLIPVFSTLEAVWLLQEKITFFHIISGLMVITGLAIANLSTKRK